jgi:4-hydroxybutyrate dehydrogenase / sulfolactaldehyde 3-reductase
MQIAFIGLGQMGLPMARNLIRGGHRLRVFDQLAEPAAALAAEGAAVAASPADCARGAEAVITMLPNGEAVREVLFGADGAIAAAAPGTVVVDMSTIHPLQSDALARDAAARGVAFVDAPVGRTSDHAVRGTLLIMAGADAAMVERLRPVFSLLGSEVVTAGAAGRGIRIKIVNNFMSVALNALSAEAAALCEALDLPLASAMAVMQGTPANKGHFTTTWPNKVLKGDLTPAFMIDLAHKDLGIALDVAASSALPMPMGAAAREVYSAARAAGRGRQDWSAILEQVLDAAHLPHPVPERLP